MGISKNNVRCKLEKEAKCVPRFAIRKVEMGTVSVLLATSLYVMASNEVAQASSTNPTTVKEMVNNQIDKQRQANEKSDEMVKPSEKVGGRQTPSVNSVKSEQVASLGSNATHVKERITQGSTQSVQEAQSIVDSHQKEAVVWTKEDFLLDETGTKILERRPTDGEIPQGLTEQGKEKLKKLVLVLLQEMRLAEK